MMYFSKILLSLTIMVFNGLLSSHSSSSHSSSQYHSSQGQMFEIAQSIAESRDIHIGLVYRFIQRGITKPVIFQLFPKSIISQISEEIDNADTIQIQEFDAFIYRICDEYLRRCPSDLLQRLLSVGLNNNVYHVMHLLSSFTGYITPEMFRQYHPENHGDGSKAFVNIKHLMVIDTQQHQPQYLRVVDSKSHFVDGNGVYDHKTKLLRDQNKKWPQLTNIEKNAQWILRIESCLNNDLCISLENVNKVGPNNFLIGKENTIDCSGTIDDDSRIWILHFIDYKQHKRVKLQNAKYGYFINIRQEKSNGHQVINIIDISSGNNGNIESSQFEIYELNVLYPNIHFTDIERDVTHEMRQRFDGRIGWELLIQKINTMMIQPMIIDKDRIDRDRIDKDRNEQEIISDDERNQIERANIEEQEEDAIESALDLCAQEIEESPHLKPENKLNINDYDGIAIEHYRRFTFVQKSDDGENKVKDGIDCNAESISSEAAIWIPEEFIGIPDDEEPKYKPSNSNQRQKFIYIKLRNKSVYTRKDKDGPLSYLRFVPDKHEMIDICGRGREWNIFRVEYHPKIDQKTQKIIDYFRFYSPKMQTYLYVGRLNRMRQIPQTQDYSISDGTLFKLTIGGKNSKNIFDRVKTLYHLSKKE